MLTSALASALLVQPLPATQPRFDLAYPFPNVAPVRIDRIGSGVGVAQQFARARGLQSRILWVDTTANMERYNTEEKIGALVRNAKEIGFNTIVFDIKPIVGYTIYPSAHTDQLTAWRGRTFPKGFDPIPVFIREAKSQGIKLFVSLNAFSEGHRFAKEQNQNREFANGNPGPGYALPDQQSVQVRFLPQVQIEGEGAADLSPRMNIPDPGRTYTLYDRAPERGTGFVIANGRIIRSFDGALATGERALIHQAGDRVRLRNLTGKRVRLTSEARFVRSGEDQNQIPLMMNPFDPRVRERTLAFADEVTTRYEVDGFLYDDRLRYTGWDGDFSPLTRELFEKEIGQKIRWPQDVFEVTYNWDLTTGMRPGRFWEQWWVFRAREMKRFVEQARTVVKSNRPNAVFGIYAGSWFGEYDKYGANYGAETQASGFPWMTRAMRQVGFAAALDLMIGGAYYRVPTIFDAMVMGAPEGRTVEAGAQLINRVVDDEAWAVAGISLDQFYSDPSQVQAALSAAAAASQGVMVFDLSHQFDRFEPYLRRAFARPAQPPYAQPAFLAEVRRLKRLRRQAGSVPPPVPVQPGAPGVGH